MRLSTRLPCEWQILAAPQTRSELAGIFGLSGLLADPVGSVDLAAELKHAIEQVQDVKLRYALELMGRRMEMLERALSADDTVPPAVDLSLSVDGLELASAARHPVGALCGLHLVLEDGFHFVSAAEITRCDAQDARYRIGMRFRDTDPTSQRRLARTVLRQSPRAAAASS